ncbi:MAG TPA: serine/threonine-protein kinase [Vicinamibacterales bacterium]
MAGESDDLDKLFESVADGESIDWDAREQSAPDDEALALIQLLRLIAEVSEVHRSRVDEIEPAQDATLTALATAGAVPIQSARERHVFPDVGTTPGGAPPGGVPPSAPSGGHLGVWGHLLLVRKVGEGSFGEVFQAHDTWLDHPVALKLLKPEAENWVPPAQLLHEARKLARVRHVNVVNVHGADRHKGRVGFWMDFIDGETLATRVSKGSLSAGEAASVGQEVCKALAAVHRANIIHRDVKAQNVMRAHDGGRIILMDFGAGEFLDDPRETRAQGTPLYLAPEVLEGGEATVRSDIYACGVLLYHLVSARFPVEGASLEAIRAAHARGERRRLRDARPDLPESFIAIVERAIDPNPAWRYWSAGEMEAKLNGERTEPVSAPVPAAPVPRGPSLLDYLKRAAVAAAILLTLTGLLGFVAARAFEVVLRIDPDFSLGLKDILTVGAQALLPFVTYWVLGAAAIAVIAGVRVLLPAGVRGLSGRAIAAIQGLNAAGVATLVLLAGVVLALAITRTYWDVFAVLWALREDPLLPQTAMSILEPASRPIHQDHGVYSALLSFVLGFMAWRLFPYFERSGTDASTSRAMKWGTVAVALLVVAMAVAPRRAVWDSFAVASFDNHTALVIGTTTDELLLYAPNEPGRPRFRVRKDALGLRLTGETRALFERGH